MDNRLLKYLGKEPRENIFERGVERPPKAKYKRHHDLVNRYYMEQSQSLGAVAKSIYEQLDGPQALSLRRERVKDKINAWQKLSSGDEHDHLSERHDLEEQLKTDILAWLTVEQQYAQKTKENVETIINKQTSRFLIKKDPRFNLDSTCIDRSVSQVHSAEDFLVKSLTASQQDRALLRSDLLKKLDETNPNISIPSGAVQSSEQLAPADIDHFVQSINTHIMMMKRSMVDLNKEKGKVDKPYRDFKSIHQETEAILSKASQIQKDMENIPFSTSGLQNQILAFADKSQQWQKSLSDNENFKTYQDLCNTYKKAQENLEGLEKLQKAVEPVNNLVKIYQSQVDFIEKTASAYKALENLKDSEQKVIDSRFDHFSERNQESSVNWL